MVTGSLDKAENQAEYAHPFRNPELAMEQRIDNLLSLMTLEEKVECLGTNPKVPRLGVMGSGHVEGLHGLALGGPGRWGRDEPISTTTFPQAIGLAQTWDPELLRRVGEVEAIEARHVFHRTDGKRGGIVVRAPNADLGRDPRWGRTEECYGEDPYFNGVMTVAFVKGLQGSHPKYWRCASLMKHFLANSNENEREYWSASFDERLFYEYYSVAFRMGIQRGGSRAFMAAYNGYNGVPCTVHPMLKQIAVERWGQDGIICTDGGAFKLLVSQHHYFADLFQAARSVLHAGITQFLDRFHDGVNGALERGLLTEADLEAAIRPNFRVMIRLGLWDPPERVPYTQIDPVEDPCKREEHRKLVREVTQKSIVLLKNSDGLLPLDQSRLRSLAVVGPWSDRVLLDWYSGTPPYRVTVLDGLKARLGEGVSLREVADNQAGRAEQLARQSDAAIVCVGNHPVGDAPWAQVTKPSYGKEAIDRQTLSLEDEELIQQVYAANRKTIVVLMSSFPYAINWTNEHVPAIVHTTHNSQELGSALCDVLFGDVSPGGRLVQTWPKSLEGLPSRLDYDIRHGHTYLYSEKEPLYPFGYGLSYTTFEYVSLQTNGGALRADRELGVHVKVKNSGTRTGDEVVQMYVRYLDSAVTRPRRMLVDFRRVTIEPQQTEVVTLGLRPQSLLYWDISRQGFVLEPGKVEILVGRSSRDIEFSRTVTVTV